MRLPRLGTAIALTEKPVFEVPLPIPVGTTVPIHRTRPHVCYAAPYAETAGRLGADRLWVVQETESRLIPSGHALELALQLAGETAARWFICAHSSTLGTTESEVAYASSLIKQTGAELLYLVPPSQEPRRSPGLSAVGDRLEEHRVWCGWSVSSLGEILGIAPGSMSGILAGCVTASTAQIEHWAQRLGLAHEWLEGRRPCFKWGTEVLRLRQQFREKPLPECGDLRADARLRQLLRFAEAGSPLCRAGWFLPGILGMGWWEYQRFLHTPGPADAAARERFCSVFHLPLRYLLGDSPADFAEESFMYSIALGGREARQ